GVTRHADVGAGGALGAFTTLQRSAVGDARGAPPTLHRESISHYPYARDSRDYGVTVWMDARNAADCPAVDSYRQSLIDGLPIAPPPPLIACPAQFANSHRHR